MRALVHNAHAQSRLLLRQRAARLKCNAGAVYVDMGSDHASQIPHWRRLPLTCFEHRVAATPGGKHACILTVVGLWTEAEAQRARVREDHLSRELFGRPSRDSPDLLLVLRPTDNRCGPSSGTRSGPGGCPPARNCRRRGHSPRTSGSPEAWSSKVEERV